MIISSSYVQNADVIRNKNKKYKTSSVSTTVQVCDVIFTLEKRERENTSRNQSDKEGVILHQAILNPGSYKNRKSENVKYSTKR